jgi:hypothetical protein
MKELLAKVAALILEFETKNDMALKCYIENDESELVWEWDGEEFSTMIPGTRLSIGRS